MKSLKITLAVLMFSMFAFTAQAQSNQRTNVGQLASGLITAQVGAIAVNVGDITLEDLVDVGDVLSNNRDIEILSNILNNSPIASNNQDFLNDLLRDAELITDNQIVVGILSGQFVIQDL